MRALLLGLPLGVAAGPYPPAVGGEGSTAIASDDSAIVAWATGWVDYLPGSEVAEEFQTPEEAIGAALPPDKATPFDIVSLGRGGSIILTFDRPIADGTGADFAVFENANVAGFLELAFVEVSSNGTDFVRFPNDSLTPFPVGPFANLMDASEVDGFAGKYILGYGTPFDLAELPDDPAVDPSAIRFVRLVDIFGDGSMTDSSGDPIYDPTPTAISAGFDLDAVAVLHERPLTPVAVAAEAHWTGDHFELRWIATPGANYRVESSPDLREWTTVHEATATSADGVWGLPLGGGFFRVSRLED